MIQLIQLPHSLADSRIKSTLTDYCIFDLLTRAHESTECIQLRSAFLAAKGPWFGYFRSSLRPFPSIVVPRWSSPRALWRPTAVCHQRQRPFGWQIGSSRSSPSWFQQAKEKLDNRSGGHVESPWKKDLVLKGSRVTTSMYFHVRLNWLSRLGIPAMRWSLEPWKTPSRFVKPKQPCINRFTPNWPWRGESPKPCSKLSTCVIPEKAWCLKM